MRRNRSPLVMALLLAVSFTACSEQTAASSDEIVIIATTSILGDVVANVTGDGAGVEVLMGPGVDPHDFAPSARQVEMIGDADLVVANGLGLEESLHDVFEGVAAEGGAILELGPLVDPIPFVGDDHEEGEDEEEDAHGDEDPHFWQDPQRMALAVEAIVEALAEIEPQLDWATTADAYISDLEALDAEITDLLGGIPPADRVLVTNHEAFGYFADRYGFEIVAVVIGGGSTLAEPSASDLADLASTIRQLGVEAIFTENTSSASLAEAVASEVGSTVTVHELVSDSLGDPTGPAATYIDMMRSNATIIADALS